MTIDPEKFSELTNALQAAVLLAGRLTVDAQAETAEANQLYAAVARAVEAARQLRGAAGGAARPAASNHSVWRDDSCAHRERIGVTSAPPDDRVLTQKQWKDAHLQRLTTALAKGLSGQYHPIPERIPTR